MYSLTCRSFRLRRQPSGHTSLSESRRHRPYVQSVPVQCHAHGGMVYMVGWWGLLVGVLELSSYRHYDVMGLERLALGELMSVSLGSRRSSRYDRSSLSYAKNCLRFLKAGGYQSGCSWCRRFASSSTLKGIPKVFIDGDRCKLCESGAPRLSAFNSLALTCGRYYQPRARYL